MSIPNIERRYYGCEFKPGGKAFTYHYDGPELFVGDRVKVPDRDGIGWQRVTVISVTDKTPSFPSKEILGRVEDAPLPDVSPLERLAEQKRREAEAASRTSPAKLKYDTGGPRGEAAQEAFDRDLWVSGDDDEIPF
jgi:hypothetical protein